MFSKIQQKKFVIKVLAIFLLFFLVQLAFGVFILYEVVISQTRSYLESISERVKEDITYSQGKWEMKRYYADPKLPETFPLYIFSTTGFVLDRWKPVHGFLDTSDVQKLLSYQTPQTITSDIDQTWRIVSRSITSHGRVIGVITAAIYRPGNSPLSDVDNKLNSTVSLLHSKIEIKDNNISTVRIDPRDLPYDISFQIVDSFNRIVLKSNNTNSIDQIPNFLDRSYIGDILNGPDFQYIRDSVNNSPFLILSTSLFDPSKNIIGVIVVGRTIDYLYSIIENFFIMESISGLVLFTFGAFLIYRLISRYTDQVKQYSLLPQKFDIKNIRFDKKTGVILLDNKEIPIPYATNQYYLIEALFSNPKKRWEVDELLVKFGEHNLTNSRKVYDATNSINRKVGEFLPEKLVIVKDKTYQLNPLLLQKVA